MLNDQRAIVSTTRRHEDEEEEEDPIIVRDIHAMTPPASVPRRDLLRLPSSISMTSTTSENTENFTTISREFNALVVAGAAMDADPSNNLGRIGEEDGLDREINQLAIVPDVGVPPELDAVQMTRVGDGFTLAAMRGGDVALQRVKKEEVEAKIIAWQDSKVAKINNRFKCEEAIIRGWEEDRVQKATSWMKKVERKLDEKRAKAEEQMRNDIAKAHRKAEERRASAEAKRGTKVAKVFQIASLMRAVGRPPAKRSFF